MSRKAKGLGRGLSALIKETDAADGPALPPADRNTPPEDAPKKPTRSNAGTKPEAATGRTMVKISRIKANEYQPRTEFDMAALQDLAASIKEHGILQAITVRASKTGYELIAGERRLRASKEVGLKEVPVNIIEADDQTSLALALIENLQREDLNVIEEALGYQRLAEEFSLTQDQISRRVGKSRASVANAMRLLGLSEEIRERIRARELSAGHAKVLLGLDDPEQRNELAEKIAKLGMSVRDTEKQVQRLRNPSSGESSRPDPDLPAIYLQDVADRLNRHFGTKVQLSSPRTGADGVRVQGRIEIEYYNNDDLDRILQMVGLDIN